MQRVVNRHVGDVTIRRFLQQKALHYRRHSLQRRLSGAATMRIFGRGPRCLRGFEELFARSMAGVRLTLASRSSDSKQNSPGCDQGHIAGQCNDGTLWRDDRNGGLQCWAKLSGVASANLRFSCPLFSVLGTRSGKRRRDAQPRRALVLLLFRQRGRHQSPLKPRFGKRSP